MEWRGIYAMKQKHLENHQEDYNIEVIDLTEWKSLNEE